ncbi:hypothetical protein [Rugamonas sp.]|uniref:hypothetical protein n=1 Tax=Rugamonas sp. TaxID=1926287 RepID=UPI0025F287D4|nr:hypothetical protein [Rugamonas sp.]
MNGEYPDLIADVPEPYNELLGNVPALINAPQTWSVSVSDAKFHWYDLVAGFPSVPDIRDPVGRYLRRMQFDLEATTEKRLLYFVVTRPRIRFDAKRTTQWGFFSLKLTIPLLVGVEEERDSITIELEVPFAATLKKPTVTLFEQFITLNWGGLVEAWSIHDVLQNFDNDHKFPSKILYVGQTKDPSGRLAKGRLAAIQKLHQQYSEDSDMLLLVQRLTFAVASDEGDPADLPENQNPVAVDALSKDRMDLVENALIKYFEEPSTRTRSAQEMLGRRERIVEVQAAHKVEQFRIDLRLEESGKYHELKSDKVATSHAHVIDCVVLGSEIGVTRVVPEVRK